MNLGNTFAVSVLFLHFSISNHICKKKKKGQKQKANTLLELLVFGAPSFSQESLSQLLQIPRVIHLNLCLLAEEILQVLQ